MAPGPDDDERAVAEFLTAKLTEFRRKQRNETVATVGELWAAWFPAYVQTPRGRHCARTHQRHIEQLFPLAPAELDGVRLAEWRKYLLSLTKRAGTQPLSDGYRDQIVATLRLCFMDALEEGKISRNPLRKFARFERYPKRRQGYYSAESLWQIVSEVPAIYRAMLRLGARTGLRKTAVRLLRKDALDEETKEVVVQLKGGRVTRVQLDDSSWEEVHHWSKISVGPYVFGNPRDPRGAPLATSTMNNWQRKARDKTGLLLAGEKPCFHHTRHALVMQMIADGAPISEIVAQGGWADIQQVVQTYGATRGKAREALKERLNASPLGLPPRAKGGGR